MEIDWFSRQIANTIFGTIPTTSYEEALSYFSCRRKDSARVLLIESVINRAVFISFESGEEAKKWLSSSLDIPVITEEDKKDRKTVEALLKKFNPKIPRKDIHPHITYKVQYTY